MSEESERDIWDAYEALKADRKRWLTASQITAIENVEDLIEAIRREIEAQRQRVRWYQATTVFFATGWLIFAILVLT